MNKKELIAAMVTKTGSSKADADLAVAALTEIISDTLKKGDSLSLPGFGSFEVRERPARRGRNPRTGEPLKIAASRIPAFKAGATLKAAVNSSGSGSGKNPETR
ncbi:MAG: HU family DNA-binding protein [Nitrosospira sp.]|nr:HU family DNA-binding protein [Nitrosospira sp.]